VASAVVFEAMKRKPTKGSKAKPVGSEPEHVTAETPPPKLIDVTSVLTDDPVPHLVLRASGVLDESSLPDFFASASQSVLTSKAKRVLVDLRGAKITLSISDLHDLVKMAATRFLGVVERLAIVPTESDILREKFFEPALTSRGVPTLATVDYDEALYWLSSKLRPGLS
jgi:hypothetical protein